MPIDKVTLFLVLFFLILNSILLLNFDFISKKINIFDDPDNRLKKHKKKTSLLGGSIIVLNVIVFFLINLLLKNSLIDFELTKIISFLFIIFSFYLVGIYDDVKKIIPKIKLLFIIFSSLVAILYDRDLGLNLVEISFIEKNYSLSHFSVPFTVLCFALLANAFNMFDGIDLQLILFSIFVFAIFLFKSVLMIFSFIILINLFFVLFLNYKNKIFLGDSGAFVLSGIIGFILIDQYENNIEFFLTDEIFIILMVPGIDMLRLFIFRIYKKQNPFSGDLNHLHHILKRKFKSIVKTNFVLSLFYLIPFICLIIGFKTYLIFSVYCLIYISIISYSLRKI